MRYHKFHSDDVFCALLPEVKAPLTVSIKLYSPAAYLILISSEMKSDINVKRRQTKQDFRKAMPQTRLWHSLRNLILGSRGQRSPGCRQFMDVSCTVTAAAMLPFLIKIG